MLFLKTLISDLIVFPSPFL
uniref:Uncharacterized protein n=1 Tax=Rhizophora mucronata TaxID=61149 RepID=A0A2P2JWY9_RHIMU